MIEMEPLTVATPFSGLLVRSLSTLNVSIPPWLIGHPQHSLISWSASIT